MSSSIRQTLSRYEGQFIQVTKNFSGVHNEQSYLTIEKILQFIRSKTCTIEPEKLKKVILLLGTTGAGKSTTLTYLNLGDQYLQISDGNGSLQCKQVSKEQMTFGAEIGKGDESTTLVPNLINFELGQGIFMDCAGDGDTGGILADIINTEIRMLLSANIQSAKIIFVTKIESLTSSGGYGACFKESLKNTSEFLKDINHFKDSMGIIVTGTSKIKKSKPPTPHQFCVGAIEAILKKQPDIKDLKQAIQGVLDKDYIQTFAKPLDTEEEGSGYTPPEWNLDQRNKIAKMIDKVQFASIPSNYFKTFAGVQVRQKMAIIGEILIRKLGHIVFEKVTKAKKP